MPLDDVFDAVPPTDDRLDQPVPLASGVVTFEVTGEVSPLGPNLLLNPSADDGLNYWSNTGSSGTATMPVSGRTVFFVEDDPVDRARFNQTVEIPENQRGKWALLIGYGWTEHIVQESITRHPYLIGFPNAGLSLQGQNLLHTEDENTWQTMWGIFELDAAISTINFQAAQAYQIGDDPDGTRAVFDDLELVIFETQAAAEAYRDLYIVDHPVTYEELSNP